MKPKKKIKKATTKKPIPKQTKASKLESKRAARVTPHEVYGKMMPLTKKEQSSQVGNARQG